MKLPTGSSGAQELLDDFLTRIDDYEDTRNFPAVKGPSYLSVHLRFGTISIRQLAREAWQRAAAALEKVPADKRASQSNRKLAAEIMAANRDAALAELRERFDKEAQQRQLEQLGRDRKSTRLNSSHT